MKMSLVAGAMLASPTSVDGAPWPERVPAIRVLRRAALPPDRGAGPGPTDAHTSDGPRGRHRPAGPCLPAAAATGPEPGAGAEHPHAPGAPPAPGAGGKSPGAHRRRDHPLY